MHEAMKRADIKSEPRAPQQHSTLQAVPAAPPAPSHEDIARRAYELYEKKGRRGGQCEQNWNQAERQLRSHAAPPGSPDPNDPATSTSSGAEAFAKAVATPVPVGTGGSEPLHGTTTPPQAGIRACKA